MTDFAHRLLTELPEGVVVCSPKGAITFLNRAAGRITGWAEPDALGRLVQEVLRLSDEDWAHLLAASLAEGSRAIQVNGEASRALAISATRLEPAGDQSEQIVLMLRRASGDESERHLHAYFLANISHEFRTPLSGLKASLELLLDEFDYLSPLEIYELLSSIHLGVSSLQTLVDNLLESGRIEAGRFAIQRSAVEINHVIAEAVRLMQPLLDRRAQRLSLTEPLLVPPVSADPNRLTQVLINLLSNASKYGPSGEEIALILNCEAHYLRVAVADRGPGIPPGERDSLFRRFTRLSTPAATTQYGIGLGLSVVKRIVEEHQGQVGIEDRPGGGAVVWFTLPLAGRVG